MMSHAHRRQSSETAGPFSSHPQPRVAAASERHGIAVPRRTSPGKNRWARHVAAETELSRQAARRAEPLQHGGGPEPGRGRGEAAELRAREPCRRTHAHRQSDQERARTPRHPRLRRTLCTAVQRLERLPTPEREPVPSNTLAELRRERARLRLLANQIREIETARLQRLEQRLNCGVHPMVRLLARVRSLDIGTADHPRGVLARLARPPGGGALWRSDRLAEGPVADDQHRAVLVTPRPQLEEQMRGLGQIAELVE